MRKNLKKGSGAKQLNIVKSVVFDGLFFIHLEHKQWGWLT
jgi:stalled ribosome alternative rescue factor ArfA